MEKIDKTISLDDEINSLIDLVIEMRNAQKYYFRCRDGKSLKIAKEWESKVDKAIKVYKYGEPQEQHSLL